jgi:putative hydrolase of the HAD superfamily
MNSIKHVFFDLDNTLWDFEKNSREALLELFLLHDIERKCCVNFNSFILVYEAINHQLWEMYGQKKITKDELRYQRFYKAFCNYGLDELDLAYLWADEYLRISPYKKNLIEGSTDILTYLNQKYSVHIITNGFKEVQDIKLEQNNLKPFFQKIIISEEHGVSKPQIEIFKLAQQYTNSIAEECIMIGDNYEADVLGAVNANWNAVHLSKEKINNLESKIIHISQLKELKNIL